LKGIAFIIWLALREEDATAMGAKPAPRRP
jgi:hypothetical protein